MQKQLIVSPNSITLENLGEGKHFGEVNGFKRGAKDE